MDIEILFFFVRDLHTPLVFIIKRSSPLIKLSSSAFIFPFPFLGSNPFFYFSNRQGNHSGWLGAMVLGSFQCRGVLLLWHMVGQGPAVLAGGVGCPIFLF